MQKTMVINRISNENKVKIYWTFIGFVSLFYLLVSVNTPLSILAWQTYDDMLFINLAKSFSEGQWFGDYNELTLVKGPGYPIFLALNNWLGLPVTFTHALFYCFSLGVLSFLSLKISKSYLLALLLFVLPLWDPRFFEVNRVIRDSIYTSQAILIISTFSYLLLSVNSTKRHDVISMLLGLLLGWFWLTREEGVWIIPALIFIIIFARIRNKHQITDIKLLRPVFIMMFFFTAVLFSFSLGNKIVYGSFVSVDLKEKNFQSAYKSMESIRVGEPIPFVSVPRKTRDEIYKISPAFLELKSYIDPDDGASVWEAGGCLFRPTACGDISNGFFYFAMREAAAKVGYYSTPYKASKFFEKINSDIQSACDDHRLSCEPSLIPYVPPMTLNQLKMLPSSLNALISSIFKPGEFYESTIWDITAPEETFNKALSVLNYPEHFPMLGNSSIKFTEVELAGWYHNKDKGNEWFQLKASDASDKNIPYTIVRVDSSDLVKTFQDKYAIQQRFKIKTKCGLECVVIFSSPKHPDFVLSLKDPKKYMSFENITLAFDYIDIQSNKVNLTKSIRTQFSIAVREFFYNIYELLLPVLIGLGLVAFIFSGYFALKRSDYPVALVIAGACWVSILTRAAILVLVDISAFPAIVVSYMLPIYTLSIIASVLSVVPLMNILQYSGKTEM